MAYDNVPGNHYDKYATGNPIARALVAGFLRNLDDLVTRSGARTIYEVGCGEGELSVRMMQRGLSVAGSDLEPSVVAQAIELARAKGFEPTFHVADIYTLTKADVSADLVLCCEVMEHLPDPEKALDALAGLVDRHLILSVPREPLWRVLNLMRGKYLGQLGNTPGHIQHWSRKAFLSLVETRFNILEVRAPLPWTMLLCERRS